MSISTIKDVARKAGVSAATVSFIVNNRYPTRIPESTRRRVQAAVKHLGYRPNRLARGLASGRTQTIGILYDGSTSLLMSDRFSVRLFSGVLETCSAAGWRTLVVSLDDHARPRESPFSRGEVDGIMYLAAKSPSISRRLSAEESPMVLLNPDFVPPRESPAVLIDDRAAVENLVEHLHGLGHRHFVYVSGFLAAYQISPRSFKQRHAAYERTLKAKGLHAYPAEIFHFSTLESSARVIEQAATLWKRILAARPRATAVICANDLIAQAMWIAARQIRIAIPQRFSLAGIDDILQEVWQESVLTSVRIPADEMGARAVELLSSLINGNSVSLRQTVVAGHLVIRGTSGPPTTGSKRSHRNG